MELNVTAYDNHGIEFDDDQYKFMKFDMDIESIGVKRARELSTHEDQNNNRIFIAHGNEPGTYQINAFTYKSSNTRVRVISDLLKIEVFPLLVIHPAELLLTPHMRYTLQIVGGPTRSTSSLNTGSV